MQRAVDGLEKLSNDPKTRRLAEERERGLFAYHHAMHASRKEGREEGREEGVKEGQVAVLGEVLTTSFDVPKELVEALGVLDAVTLKALVPKVLGAKSLDEVVSLLNEHGCSVRT